MDEKGGGAGGVLVGERKERRLLANATCVGSERGERLAWSRRAFSVLFHVFRYRCRLRLGRTMMTRPRDLTSDRPPGFTMPTNGQIMLRAPKYGQIPVSRDPGIQSP